MTHTRRQIAEIRARMPDLNIHDRKGIYSTALYTLPKEDQNTILRHVAALKAAIYAKTGDTMNTPEALELLGKIGIVLYSGN
jgi:hypothetical protein